MAPQPHHIQPDELLQSYIIRRLTITGAIQHLQDLDSVVGKNNRWEILPTISAAALGFFSHMTFSEKTELVRHHSNLWTDHFSPNPFSLRAHTAHIFEQYVRRPRDITWVFPAPPILYCPDCFREQLANDGFTWFRKAWVSSDWCHRHSKQLEDATCPICRNSANSLLHLAAVQSGICKRCHSNVWGDTAGTEQSQHPKPLHVQEGKKEFELYCPFEFSPCYIWATINRLIPLIARHAFRHPKSSEENIWQNLIRYHENAHPHANTLKIFDAYMLCHELESANSALTANWINRNSEIIELDGKPYTGLSITIPYRTLVDRTCDTCTVDKRDCPLQTNSEVHPKSCIMEHQTLQMAQQVEGQWETQEQATIDLQNLA